jgi:hypothetical protein
VTAGRTPSAAPIVVIQKTAAQQVRSARYTWLVSAGLGLVTLCTVLSKIAPHLGVFFPGHTAQIAAVGDILAVIGGSGATLGAAMLGSQRQNSVGDEALAAPHDPTGYTQ